MADTKIVPFGKYKGQPIEVLAADKGYCDWLSNQDWFRSRFNDLHVLIINNFGQASDTPEHNALQLLFLDPDFAVKCLLISRPHAIDERLQRARLTHQERLKTLQTEERRTLDSLEIQRSRSGVEDNYYQYLMSEHRRLAQEISTYPDPPNEITVLVSQEFERSGVDVSLTFLCRFHRSSGNHAISDALAIECKPIISDDYPAVLRQARANKCDVVVTREFSSSVASLDAVRRVFGDIDLLLVSDIESINIPEYVKVGLF